MPLNQVATVSAPEPRMLSVQVWDKSNVGPVEKAIRSAGLGLNPINDGNTLRLPIPDLTEERRKELAKLASLCRKGPHRDPQRPPRRHGCAEGDENKKEISEDERKRGETEVQKLTDEHDQGRRRSRGAEGKGNPRQVSRARASPSRRNAQRLARAMSRSSWTATGAGPKSATCRARWATSAGLRRCARWSAPRAKWGWRR
jgi:hypothetical protein